MSFIKFMNTNLPHVSTCRSVLTFGCNCGQYNVNIHLWIIVNGIVCVNIACLKTGVIFLYFVLW